MKSPRTLTVEAALNPLAGSGSGCSALLGDDLSLDASGNGYPVRSGAEPISLHQRIENYCRETGFPKSLFISDDGRMVGTWIMGNDYRVKSTYYGGYPAGYLRRIKALFPDKRRVLHLFSGRVDVGTLPGKTVDINESTLPDYVDDAQTLNRVPLEEFDLVCADPPYSVEDCDHYQTTMVKRNVVMRALGARLLAGTHVVWLDQVLPMYRKDQFMLEGVIGMVKSTNHRFRVVTIFRAAAGGAEPVGRLAPDDRQAESPNAELSGTPPTKTDHDDLSHYE